MIVLAQLHLALFGLGGPDPDGLVVATAGHQAAVQPGQDSNHPHPFTVARVCFHAVAGGYLPHLDGFVSRRGQNVIA